MKKVNFRNALMALVVTLTFLVMGTGQASAQSLSGTGSGSGVMVMPTGDFYTAVEAQTVLNNRIMEIKMDIDDANQAVITAGERQIIYYRGIHALLESGQDNVARAIVEGLSFLNDSNNNSNLTNAQRLALKQLAIDDLEQ
jgi:hypothetical protein